MSALPPNEILIFRSLKKCALVLMLLIRLDKPIGETEISKILDLDPKTVRSNLRSLSTLGWVTRTKFKNGYILTQAGRQLVLGSPVETLAAGPAEALPEPASEPDSGGISRNPITTTINTESINLSDSLIVVEERDSGKISRNEGESPPDSPLLGEILESFAEFGITPNHRTRRLAEKLAKTPGFIPDDIRAHYLELERRGKGSHTGLLITILESGAPALELNARKHLIDCDCDECKWLPYLQEDPQCVSA